MVREARFVVREQCQAEIEQFDRTLVVYQQVGRFHIPVDEALVMGVLQSDRRLRDVIGGRFEFERAIVLDDRLQVPSRHILPSRGNACHLRYRRRRRETMLG